MPKCPAPFRFHPSRVTVALKCDVVLYWLEVVLTVHSETALGKTIVDVHFAPSMKQVHIYMREKKSYVTKPVNAIYELRYEGEVENDAVELLCLTAFKKYNRNA